MKQYIGIYNSEEHDWEINVIDEKGNTYKLDFRLDLHNHSPTGFSWGYGGSGPAQTAIALLADVFNIQSEIELMKYGYQDFKWQKIATIPMEKGFTMTDEDIKHWYRMREVTK